MITARQSEDFDKEIESNGLEPMYKKRSYQLDLQKDDVKMRADFLKHLITLAL